MVKCQQVKACIVRVLMWIKEQRERLEGMIMFCIWIGVCLTWVHLLKMLELCVSWYAKFMEGYKQSLNPHSYTSHLASQKIKVCFID